MDFYESDLEDILFYALQSKEGCERLNELGMDIGSKPMKTYRQLRIGNYGIADLVTVNKTYNKGNPSLHIKVYELKKDAIDEKALMQVHRYAVGIRHYLDLRNYSDFLVETFLVGRKVSDSDWVYFMEEGFLSNVFTYQYSIDGIKFNRDSFGYRLVQHNFK